MAKTIDYSDQNIPEFPNVSTSAIAYLLQATEELAAEQKFKLDDKGEDEVRNWIKENSQAIAQRAKNLQLERFNKFQANRETICKVVAASIWGKIRTENINIQVNAAIDDALR
jgi:abortive infection bacteriophage resistance protein